jgi:nucleoside-diphosphate-sugar epimerase
MNTQAPIALVLGATGSIGGEVARALLAKGWRVRGLNRNLQSAKDRGPAGVEWIAGDAMIAADVIRAAEGVSVIFHGTSPPGYTNWAKLVPTMLNATIAAAKASGARIVFPGNVYNYGPDAWSVIGETSPQHPKTRKGAIRVALEDSLQSATKDGVRSLIVRAGDFFGPTSDSSWLTEGWVAKHKPIKAITFPGPGHIRHAWAYLPDFAQSIVQLIDQEALLPDFAVFNHGGHQITGAELAAALEQVAGYKLARRTLPWFGIAALSPFVEMMREMLEMRYLWDNEVLMDNAKLVKALGTEPHTPLDEALRTALIGQGCLPQSMSLAA